VKTDLSDRVLFYDGTSQVRSELVPELLLCGVPPSKLRVLYHSADAALFNQLSDEPLTVGGDIVFTPDLSWQLPKEWAELDLDNFFDQLLTDKAYDYDSAYQKRVVQELEEVRRRGLEPLIRTLAYVVYVFNLNRQVWGVGRGSSCASLLLYLIGLHQVDPIKYGIPLEEFFHD